MRVRATNASGGGGGGFDFLFSAPDEFKIYLGATTQTYTLQKLPKLLIYHATGGSDGKSAMMFVDPKTQTGLLYETVNANPYLKDPVVTDQTASGAVGPVSISASSVQMKAYDSGANPRQELLIYY